MSLVYVFLTNIFLLWFSLNFGSDIYSKFHQTDYKVEFQRAEVVSCEKSVCNIFEIKTFKFNRTFTAFNSTFNLKKTLSAETQAIVQVYKFLSNEYRRYSPIRFQMNFCRSLNENIGGIGSILKCGNFSTCEVLQNTTYKTCNNYLDESRFPPLVPDGEYKARIAMKDGNQKIITFDVYIRIYRPLRYN